MSGPKLPKRLTTSSKAKRAAAMCLSGMRLDDIAQKLGYASSSGVAMLLERYRRELPREALEALQTAMLARLETIETMALDDAHSEDPVIRDRAQRRIIRSVEARARIAGVVKAPPAFVMVHQAAQGPDLSRLSIAEIEEWQRMQAKLLEAPIVAHGEVVDDGDRRHGEAADERDGPAPGLDAGS